MVQIVRISRELLDRLASLSAAEPAREICGLLLGDGDRIAAIEPARNVAADPAAHFEIDPAVLIAAYRRERNGGARVIGHYHSHPSGDARPSDRDAADAAGAGRLWLILGRDGPCLWREAPAGSVAAAFEATVLRVESIGAHGAAP
jgi:proteasome lid subunit RPN8/RPN11